MRGHLVRNTLLLALALALAAAVWWVVSEKPVAVDTARVSVGPMAVTVEEDGATRVKEVYRISSPVSGNVDRSLLEIGDPVKAGETVVATINPLEPSFIDERSRAEARARVEAARAAVDVARASLNQARSQLSLSQSDYERAQRLSRSNTIAESQLERARIDVELKKALVSSAEAQVELRLSELASARAMLIQPGDQALREPDDKCCVRLRAPIDGVVLDLAVKSEQVVAAGALLAEIGDPRDLEIVVARLSSDAVRIRAGSKALITGWGGDPIVATVHRIDPAGFTKVSALGIEEKRVNAVLDLDRGDPALGHGFQVRVQLEVWRSETAARVPIAALFREGSDWAVFAVEDGRAKLIRVEIGQMNNEMAEVLSGISDGQPVIVYPGDVIDDGTLVEPRQQG